MNRKTSNRITARFFGLAITIVLLMPSLHCCKSPKEDNRSDSEIALEVLPTERGVTVLFNGTDLSGWYTYLRPPEPTSMVEGLQKEEGKYVKPLGLNNDPLHVFSVVKEDGKPAIRISGEVFGVLITEKEYENYHLSVEYKWGDQKYPPRMENKRDSGILYHSVGKEGAKGGAWMRSVELQVQQGDTGDLWCVDSTTTRVRATRPDENERFRYDPQAPFQTIDMRGERYCKRSEDFEKDKGQWNQVDLYVYQGESIHVVNGRKNMHLTDIGQIINGEVIALNKGKIQLQSEGAEIFYRNITLWPITELPEVE